MTTTLHLGDCLDILPTLEEGSIDAIITDLPYGTTACKWDVVIPFEPMWAQVKRLLKPRGAFVTTASQPFTSLLVCSNPKWFKYEWIWDKHISVGMHIVKYRPMQNHENILVFSKNTCTYNPQMTEREKPITGRVSHNNSKAFPLYNNDRRLRTYTKKHPTSIIVGNHSVHNLKKDIPTQKPIALYEYLIRTYTNEGDMVLDFCFGSGTTGVAAVKLGRNFIGIEKDASYFEIAQKRIAEAQAQGVLL